MANTPKTCGIFLFSGTDLLICHSTGSNPYQWSIPKGMQDENESTLETALREFAEETGVVLTSEISSLFLYMGKKLHKSKAKELHGFLAFCKEKPNKFVCNSLTPASFPEIDIIEWVPIRVAIGIIHTAQKDLLSEFLTNYSAKTEYDDAIKNLKAKMGEKW